MTLLDQIEGRTNAANTSAVWKHFKWSERHHYKHETPTARDCLALLLMSPMRRGRGGCFWFKRLVNKLQHVMFSTTIACIQTVLHELAGQGSKSKARGNSVLKHLLIIC